MKITANVDLTNPDFPDEFKITNSEGVELTVLRDDEDEEGLQVRLDLYIYGDPKDLVKEANYLLQQAKFMEELVHAHEEHGWRVLWETDSDNGAGEDPYMDLYLKVGQLEELVKQK